MSYATSWERDYARRTQECVEAKGVRDSRPQPHLWPASGPNAMTWNPTPESSLPPQPTEGGGGDDDAA